MNLARWAGESLNMLVYHCVVSRIYLLVEPTLSRFDEAWADVTSNVRREVRLVTDEVQWTPIQLREQIRPYLEDYTYADVQ